MIKNNLIVISFAFKEDFNSSENLKNKNIFDIYLKNSFVACYTAKKHNKDCRVIFAVNFVMPDLFLDSFRNNDIEVVVIPYKKFLFGQAYPWSLAFYKLNVLDYICKQFNFDKIIYLDADCIIQNNFDNIWKEIDYNILLYDINHGYGVKDYNIFISEVKSFENSNTNLTHYGGEFFGATKNNGIQFVNECLNIYNKMISNNFITTKGDEFIVSIAGDRLKFIVKNAGAYVYRYWTSSYFRLVSTNYKSNPVCILHLPHEKERGILKIYKYLQKHRTISNNTIWKMCRLEKLSFVDHLINIKKMFFRRKF